MKVAQSCLTLCSPIDCSLPGSSVHGVLQARILGWVAISFSRNHWAAMEFPPTMTILLEDSTGLGLQVGECAKWNVFNVLCSKHSFFH